MDKYETELMEKIAKQQRSKMNKFQICYVQQLLTTEHMKRLVINPCVCVCVCVYYTHTHPLSLYNLPYPHTTIEKTYFHM